MSRPKNSQMEDVPNPEIVNEYFTYLNYTNSNNLQHNQRIYSEQAARLRYLQMMQEQFQQQLNQDFNIQRNQNSQINRQMNQNMGRYNNNEVKFDQLQALASAYNNHNQKGNSHAPYDPLSDFENQISSLYPKKAETTQKMLKLPQSLPLQNHPQQFLLAKQQYRNTPLAEIAAKSLSNSQLRQQIEQNPNYGITPYAEMKDKYQRGKDREFLASVSSPLQFQEIKNLETANKRLQDQLKKNKANNFLGEDVDDYQEKLSLERHLHDLEAKNLQLKQREFIAQQFLTDPMIKNKSSVDKVIQQKSNQQIPFYLPFNPILNSQIVQSVNAKYNIMKNENIILKEELGQQVGVDYVIKRLTADKKHVHEREMMLQKILQQNEENKMLKKERNQLLAQLQLGEVVTPTITQIQREEARKKTKQPTQAIARAKTMAPVNVQQVQFTLKLLLEWLFTIRQGGKQKLKSIITMLLFAKYYFQTIMHNKILEKRSKMMQEIISKMQSSSGELLEWIKDASKVGLEKNSLQIIQKLRQQKIELNLKKGAKEHTGKEKEKRVEEMKAIIKNIFDGLLDNFDPVKIGKEAQKLLRYFIDNGTHLPTNYLFRFEVNRLQFNSYGSTKGMNARTSHLLISCFILVRLLVFRVVMALWNHDISKQKTPLLLENCHLIGSIMHWLIVEQLRITNPVFPHNIVHIAPEMRPVFRKDPLVAPDKQVDQQFMKAYKKGELDEYLILGIASKESLSFIFEEDTLWCSNISAIIESLGIKFQEISR